MRDFSKFSKEELEKELKKMQSMFDDAEAEREFLAKQKGMHIITTEFDRIDRDLERYTDTINQIQKLIDAK